jgi:hypothetical protein
VREGAREMAAYKSAVIREFVKESSSPAVGQYQVENHKSLNNKYL